MSAPSQDISYLLENAGLGLTFATNLHIGKIPEEPSLIVVLFDGGGNTLTDLCVSEGQDDFKQIQIQVRSTDYTEGYNLAFAINKLLNGMNNFTANSGLFYLSIMNMNGPEHMGFDIRNRAKFIMNFNIERTI